MANRQIYRFNEALARIQENGRYALELMAADIRMADFWGCAGPDKIRDNLIGTPFDPPVGLDGVGTDTIKVRGAAGWGLQLAATMSSDSDPVVVNASVASGCVGNICAGDLLLVADCNNGDIFQITGISSSGSEAALAHAKDVGPPPKNRKSELFGLYDGTASVYSVRDVTYDVATSNGQPSLRRNLNDGAGPQPIVEGVENMHITFGEDTDSDGAANRYVPFTNVSDIRDVVSVRVALVLVSTEGGLTTDTPRTYDLNGDGDTSDPEDASCPPGHICQLMSSTVTLRNRVH